MDDLDDNYYIDLEARVKSLEERVKILEKINEGFLQAFDVMEVQVELY